MPAQADAWLSSFATSVAISIALLQTAQALLNGFLATVLGAAVVGAGVAAIAISATALEAM